MTTTPALPSVDLNKLTHLRELFNVFNSGRHLNRAAEPALWAALEREAEHYAALFGALGYDLRIDGRGYAWFHTQDASATVSKTTRQLALLFMLIFEQQADAGLHLGRFGDWQIDRALLDALWDRNRALLEAEGFPDAEPLRQLLEAATRYGFAAESSGGWRLLPAVCRYLDRFEELAASHQQDQAGMRADAAESAESDASAESAESDDGGEA